MKAMNWILGAVAAAAILAPLQGAKAWGGGPYGGGDYYESYFYFVRFMCLIFIKNPR